MNIVVNSFQSERIICRLQMRELFGKLSFECHGNYILYLESIAAIVKSTENITKQQKKIGIDLNSYLLTEKVFHFYLLITEEKLLTFSYENVECFGRQTILRLLATAISPGTRMGYA